MAAKVAPAPDTIVVKPKDADESMSDKSTIDPDELMDAPIEETKGEEDKKAEAANKAVSIAKMFSLCGPMDYVLIVLGTIGALANASAQPVSMIVFGDAVDMTGATGNKMMEMMGEIAIKMNIIAAASWFMATFQSGCYRLLAMRLSKKMTVMYFEAVLYQDVSWFDMQETAALPTSMADDMAKMVEAYGDKLAGAICSLGCFISSFIVAFILGWQLALVTCAAIPFIMVGAVLMAKALQETQFETQGWYAKAAAGVEECLFAMRTVVSFGGEKRELKRYSIAVEEARQGGVKNAAKAGIGLGYMDAITCWIYCLALWFGSYCMYNDINNPQTGEKWQGGEILTVFFCVFIGGFMLSQIEPGQKAMNAGRVAGARFFGAMDSMPTIQCRGGRDQRKTLGEIRSFELKDVHFSYPARPQIPILKGTSLSIQQGQKVAVVGESGSGKSTVMALLERFYDPAQGKVLVNGEDIRDFSVGSLRQHIGYVGQEPVLFAASIKVNIMQGWSAATNEDLDRVVKAANLNFVDELPEKLNTFVGSGGSQFSGGQKQRIAIARALLKKPSVLFLDEATSALDNASEKTIQATIDKIATGSAFKLTIVSIAHRLSTIQSSDQIYVLKEGQVIECGNHTQLMDMKGEYYGLAASQQMSEEGEAGENEERQNSKEALEKSGSKTPKGYTESKSETTVVLNADDAEKKRVEEIAKTYKVPMGRLLGYNKPEWPWFVPGVFCAMIHGSCYPLLSYLLVQTLHSFYKEKDDMKKDVDMLCLYFGILGLAVLFATILQQYSFGRLGEAMTKRLRIAILTHVLRQEIGFHDDPSHTPTLISNALQLWAFRVATLINSTNANSSVFAAIVIGLTIAFIACWQMSLVMLAAIPILIVSSIIQMYVLMGASKSGDASLEAQQTLSDAVQNAKTVHASGIEQMLVVHYSKLIDKQQSGAVWRCFVAGFAFGFAGAAPLFILAGGFYFGAWLIQENHADFLGIMGAFMGILFAGMGAGQAAAIVGDAAKANVACHDMFKLLDRKTQIDGLDPDGETPTWTKAEAGNIVFQGVKFAYPFRDTVQVLKGVNFEVKAGMSVGLVGPSGGGKSTIMSLIQRFYDPSEGQVLVGRGTPLNTVNIRWWRRQIGFVGQEPILFDTTVRENVLYGFDEDQGDEKPNQAFMEKCKQMANLGFIDSAKGRGWDTEVGPRGSRLSGGQKQRVAICRALMRDPPVLLLDEATSALDTASEKVVQVALEAARQGRTSFAIAHRLSTVQDCDVILVAAEGVILESGNHNELMDKQGVYYKLQMQGAGKGR